MSALHDEHAYTLRLQEKHQDTVLTHAPASLDPPPLYAHESSFPACDPYNFCEALIQFSRNLRTCRVRFAFALPREPVIRKESNDV